MTLAVDVAAGTVQINGASVSVAAVSGLAITAAHATNPRFDLVVSNNAGTVSVVTGTAASNPVFPAIPASSVVLASVYIPALATSITTADNVTDKRVTVEPAALSRAATFMLMGA